MSYTYSLSSDFGGNLLTHQLFQDIEANPSITKSLVSIDTYGDVVTIIFSEELTSEEVTALNSVISSYIYTDIELCRVESITPKYDTIGLLYSSIDVTFYYDTSRLSNLCHIKILGFINGGSFDVRVVDVTHNQIIASGSFNNTDIKVLDLGTISNIPTSTSLFEVHVKVNDAKYKVNIQKVMFYYS